jgi:hypothetical protein
MPRDCPTCSNALRGDSCPSCGWSERPAKQGFDPHWGRCSNEFQGQRCAKAGTVSRGTQGGPWFCFAHAFPSSGFTKDREAPPTGFRSIKELLT